MINKQISLQSCARTALISATSTYELKY